MANFRFVLFFSIISFFNYFTVKGQSIIENDLKNLFQAHTHEIDYAKPLKESKNEVSMLISASFLFYKSFISSQDKPSCVFTPSCSVYSVEAFKNKGLFLGWLYTFDRLSRCHPLVKPEDYSFDFAKKRFYDPID